MPYKDKARQREAIRASKRKRRAKVVAIACKSGLPEPRVNPSGPALPPDSTPRPVLTAQDARECLSRLIFRLENEPRLDLIMRARATGYLVGIFLETLEKTSIEDRLTAIETRLEAHNDGACEEA